MFPATWRSPSFSSRFFYIVKRKRGVDIVPVSHRRFEGSSDTYLSVLAPSCFIGMQSSAISDLRTLVLIGRRVSDPISPGVAATYSFVSELKVGRAFCTESANPQLTFPVGPVLLIGAVPINRADAPVFFL